MKRVVLRSFALLSFVALPVAVFVACSSDSGSGSSSSGSGGTDASSDTTNFPDVGKLPDTGGKADTGGGPTNFDECIALCAKDHPGGAAKDKAITDCWDSKCGKSCSDLDGGADLTPDGGDGGAATCATKVDTGDVACDTCTKNNCCASWDGCFNDKDCQDYEDCYNTCDQDFP
jgi:hypothetical protein